MALPVNLEPGRGLPANWWPQPARAPLRRCILCPRWQPQGLVRQGLGPGDSSPALRSSRLLSPLSLKLLGPREAAAMFGRTFSPCCLLGLLLSLIPGQGSSVGPQASRPHSSVSVRGEMGLSHCLLTVALLLNVENEFKCLINWQLAALSSTLVF